mgnify:CR=1 FL=1
MCFCKKTYTYTPATKKPLKALYFKEFLKHLILNEKWQYDIPGFITLEDLKNIIQDKLIIEKGSKLNKNTKMDASNYYVQSGDLRNIESLGKMI